MHEFRISPGARFRQAFEWRWYLSTGGQHSRRSARCFASGFAALHDQNPQSLFAERDGKRESDQAAADNDDIPGFHTGIVTERPEPGLVKPEAITEGSWRVEPTRRP